MKITLPEIHHNKKGFEALLSLHRQVQDCWFDDVEIDMSQTSWFDADMCATFGALLYRMSNQINDVSLTKLSADVEKILSKNGFLSHYGHEKIADHYGTTVAYKRFDVEDDRYFSAYIEKEFIHRSEIPTMSSGLLKKFRESIFEIFSNAVLHSRTELGVFSCGQFFPQRRTLDFTVADLGVGMQKNIMEHMETDLSPEEAIDWATTGNNTTRRGSVPGGLGLKLLCEFIDLNGGCVQIVSDAGYWQRENQNTQKTRLSHSFPGTVVSVKINTADTHSYRLESELTEKDIF